MMARHLIVLAALCLVSCKPVNGNIINGTGRDIEIVVKGVDGGSLAYGSLGRGTALSMEEGPQELATIIYRSGTAVECRMSKDQIGRSIRKGDGIWIIKLEAC